MRTVHGIMMWRSHVFMIIQSQFGVSTWKKKFFVKSITFRDLIWRFFFSKKILTWHGICLKMGLLSKNQSSLWNLFTTFLALVMVMFISNILPHNIQNCSTNQTEKNINLMRKKSKISHFFTCIQWYMEIKMVRIVSIICS